MKSVPRSEKRRPESGASSPRTTIRTRFSQPGTVFRGVPRRTVEIAFAWISGPGIGSLPDETGCRSWKVEAQGPTTTILPRKKPGRVLPSRASEKETALNVSTGPR
jgi:hypothetical protein